MLAVGLGSCILLQDSNFISLFLIVLGIVHYIGDSD